jgi:glutathione-specific gamma-glutamylcyclotransferase
MLNSNQPPAFFELTRESILSGSVRHVVAASGSMVLLSEAELEASLDRTLAAQPVPGDIWVFGYGSLIWNPAFAYIENRIGRVYGWHRRFCLWTVTSRGTPEQPGLTLGLDRGGSCRGMAFRLSAAEARHELGIIWRREMLGGAYHPHWVTVRTAGGPKAAIAFTIDRNHPRYTGPLEAETIAQIIAKASGWLGPCSDYIVKTATSLTALGIHDRALDILKERVACLKAVMAAGAG